MKHWVKLIALCLVGGVILGAIVPSPWSCLGGAVWGYLSAEWLRPRPCES